MAIRTLIQWCDSTCNGESGCDGCELWNKLMRSCYAGVMVQRLTKNGTKDIPGFPESFDKPKVFLERIDEAVRWKDLRGMVRSAHKKFPAKPWLDGYPRLIFFNDMGDTFTESLPLDWFNAKVPQMAASPHVWIVLTKRPHRMLEWAQGLRASGGVPLNFWLCVSLTGTASLGRLDAFRRLRQELPAHVLGLSIEPLLADLVPAIRRSYPDLPSLASRVKIGGESDQGRGEKAVTGRECEVEWVRGLRDFLRPTVSVFIKQLGSNPTVGGSTLALKDSHGGNWDEWPQDLRVREVPLPVRGRAAAC